MCCFWTEMEHFPPCSVSLSGVRQPMSPFGCVGKQFKADRDTHPASCPLCGPGLPGGQGQTYTSSVSSSPPRQTACAGWACCTSLQLPAFFRAPACFFVVWGPPEIKGETSSAGGSAVNKAEARVPQPSSIPGPMAVTLHAMVGCGLGPVTGRGNFFGQETF